MLADAIDRNSVFFGIFDEEKGVEAREKEDVLRIMTEKLCAGIGIPICHEIVKAVFERERDRSTGIERGLAVPHCRTHAVDRIHIALSICKQGIDWGSFDGKPTHFIFLVIGPSDKPEEYLKLLSQISRLMKSDTIRDRLFNAKTPDEVISLLKEE
jgi:mannitol/fructose-specific phosphotransferase system IIA component (Ntr-type)